MNTEVIAFLLASQRVKIDILSKNVLYLQRNFVINLLRVPFVKQIEKGECHMTFYNNKLEYRVTLDTELNLFIVFDKHDENHFATGRTIEQAVQELAKTA